MVLSSQQLELLSLARQRGFLRVQDALMVYSGSRSAKIALRRLVRLGFIVVNPDVPNTFLYVGDES